MLYIRVFFYEKSKLFLLLLVFFKGIFLSSLLSEKVKKTTFFCLSFEKNNTINRLFSSSSSFGKTFE